MQLGTANTRDAIPLVWYGWGVDYLSSQGIDEEKYRKKTIKERLLDSMAASYVLSLVDKIDEVALARLHLNRSTPNRWLKNETQPHARMFFGLLLICLQKELREVNLPTNHSVIWEAVRRTLAIIREKDCAVDDRRLVTRGEFQCVKCLLRSRDSDVLLDVDNVKRRGAVFERVLSELDRSRTCDSIRSSKDVQRVVVDWMRPYILFRIGLLPDWEILDDRCI